MTSFSIRCLFKYLSVILDLGHFDLSSKEISKSKYFIIMLTWMISRSNIVSERITRFLLRSIKMCIIRNRMDLPLSHEKPFKSIFYQHISHKSWICSIWMLKHSRRIWKFVTWSFSFERKCTSSCFSVIMWFMYTIAEAFYLCVYVYTNIIEIWQTSYWIILIKVTYL